MPEDINMRNTPPYLKKVEDHTGIFQNTPTGDTFLQSYNIEDDNDRLLVVIMMLNGAANLPLDIQFNGIDMDLLIETNQPGPPAVGQKRRIFVYELEDPPVGSSNLYIAMDPNDSYALMRVIIMNWSHADKVIQTFDIVKDTNVNFISGAFWIAHYGSKLYHATTVRSSVAGPFSNTLWPPGGSGFPFLLNDAYQYEYGSPGHNRSCTYQLTEVPSYYEWNGSPFYPTGNTFWDFRWPLKQRCAHVVFEVGPIELIDGDVQFSGDLEKNLEISYEAKKNVSVSSEISKNVSPSIESQNNVVIRCEIEKSVSPSISVDKNVEINADISKSVQTSSSLVKNVDVSSESESLKISVEIEKNVDISGSLDTNVSSRLKFN